METKETEGLEKSLEKAVNGSLEMAKQPAEGGPESPAEEKTPHTGQEPPGREPRRHTSFQRNSIFKRAMRRKSQVKAKDTPEGPAGHRADESQIAASSRSHGQHTAGALGVDERGSSAATWAPPCTVEGRCLRALVLWQLGFVSQDLITLQARDWPGALASREVRVAPRPGSAARGRPASPPPRAPLPPPLPWQPGASGARPPARGSPRQRRRRRQLRLQPRAATRSRALSSPPARSRPPPVPPPPPPAPARPAAGPMELLAAAFSAACAVDHDSSTSESDARDSAAGHLPGSESSSTPGNGATPEECPALADSPTTLTEALQMIHPIPADSWRNLIEQIGLLYQEYRDKSTLQEIETRRKQDAEIQANVDGSPGSEETPEEEEDEDEDEEEPASPPVRKALPQICLLSNPHSRFNLWQDLPEIRSSGVLDILQPEEVKLQERPAPVLRCTDTQITARRAQPASLRPQRAEGRQPVPVGRAPLGAPTDCPTGPWELDDVTALGTGPGRLCLTLRPALLFCVSLPLVASAARRPGSSTATQRHCSDEAGHRAADQQGDCPRLREDPAKWSPPSLRAALDSAVDARPA
ncbi:Ephexin-1 [Galemys pyrenaicus]|uniref:Ephexin-1 n=1 Tax=Galemys pyrenaicus TaxID=202257 RepID=A0A8J6DQ36_GALPY|nr:Ephexin-1 [Galemys pyrenaicus]